MNIELDTAITALEEAIIQGKRVPPQYPATNPLAANLEDHSAPFPDGKFWERTAQFGEAVRHAEHWMHEHPKFAPIYRRYLHWIKSEFPRDFDSRTIFELAGNGHRKEAARLLAEYLDENKRDFPRHVILGRLRTTDHVKHQRIRRGAIPGNAINPDDLSQVQQAWFRTTRCTLIAWDYDEFTGAAKSVNSLLSLVNAFAPEHFRRVSLRDDPSSIGSLHDYILDSDYVLVNSLQCLTQSRALCALLRATSVSKPIFIYCHETGYVFDRLQKKDPAAYNDIIETLGYTQVMCVSEAQRAFLEARANPAQCHVVYETHGRAFLPSPSADGIHRHILMVGSLQERKGVDLFSETADLARRRDLPYIFTWIGGLPPSHYQHNLRLSTNVHYLGRLDHQETLHYIAGADMLFLSSIDDPMPLTCIEALNSSRRVIAYTSTGFGEILPGLGGCRAFSTYTADAALTAIQAALSEQPNVAQLRSLQERVFRLTAFVDRYHHAVSTELSTPRRKPHSLATDRADYLRFWQDTDDRQVPIYSGWYLPSTASELDKRARGLRSEYEEIFHSLNLDPQNVTAVDLGCGGGISSCGLAEICRNVVLVDISLEHLREAAKFLLQHGRTNFSALHCSGNPFELMQLREHSPSFFNLELLVQHLPHPSQLRDILTAISATCVSRAYVRLQFRLPDSIATKPDLPYSSRFTRSLVYARRALWDGLRSDHSRPLFFRPVDRSGTYESVIAAILPSDNV